MTHSGSVPLTDTLDILYNLSMPQFILKGDDNGYNSIQFMGLS